MKKVFSLLWLWFVLVSPVQALTVEQEAKLAEADNLLNTVTQYHEEEKYQEALLLNEKAYALISEAVG